MLLVETVGQGQADPAADRGIRGGAADCLLRGLVQDRESRGASDLHGLDRSVGGDPEAKLHGSLDPLMASGSRIYLGLLDPAADAAEEIAHTATIATSTSRTPRGESPSTAAAPRLSRSAVPGPPGSSPAGATTRTCSVGARPAGTEAPIGRADSRPSRAAPPASWHQGNATSHRFELAGRRRWLHIRER